MSQNLGGSHSPDSEVRTALPTPPQPCLHLLLSPPCPKPGSCCSVVPQLCPRGGITGFKGLEKPLRCKKHAKNYFTDKQQRTGLVPGAEPVLYYTNILLKGKEWLKYTHSLTQIKSQCAFSIASPSPSSLHLQLLPGASARAATPPATAEHKPWVTSACASVFSKKKISHYCFSTTVEMIL